MRTLLVDNYDSYTYNLYQLLAETYGREPVVVRNDDPDWAAVDLDSFDAAVISPGPGHPARARDFGHSLDVLRQTGTPVLGVCLGHQGIGLAAGAEVRPAPEPRHGHLTAVTHDGTGVFAGLPQGFTAVRYHSLSVAEPLPPELEAVAWAEDGVVMGLRHRSHPWWGVQFHPESIATDHGPALVRSFRELALRSRRQSVTIGTARPGGSRTPDATAPPIPGAADVPSVTTAPRTPAAAPADLAVSADPADTARPARPLRAVVAELPGAVDTEAAFTALYGASTRAFWLDSARVEAGLSRFSFLGDASHPGDDVLTYRVGDDSVIVEPYGGIPHLEPGTIFEALERRLGRAVTGADALPFDLTGGYVGYLGYELKADAGGRAAHRADTPDAIWMRASRFVAVDHLAGRSYAVAVAAPDGVADAQAWTARTARLLSLLPEAGAGTGAGPGAGAGSADGPGAPQTALPVRAPSAASFLVRPEKQYLADIEECQRQLRSGESYEICLTNKLRMPAPPDDLAYYRRLRRRNPAPYAALLRLGELAVFSSSPERFLKIDAERTAESKPIKGTAPRDEDPERDELLGRTLREDPKTRAENLMIVDLLRNDLGRMCDIGSVSVPRFMAVESYTTVHQLVSTVRGRLRDGVSAVGAVRACFPGGSMTGAPKLRTMEIIDRLESEARGVYSGALGYFGFTGTADLNIVIRTAVRWRDELTVGAGGAIVLDSDTAAEYDEMLLKAEAPLRALAGPAATGAGDGSPGGSVNGSAPHGGADGRSGVPAGSVRSGGADVHR